MLAHHSSSVSNQDKTEQLSAFFKAGSDGILRWENNKRRDEQTQPRYFQILPAATITRGHFKQTNNKLKNAESTSINAKVVTLHYVTQLHQPRAFRHCSSGKQVLRYSPQPQHQNAQQVKLSYSAQHSFPGSCPAQMKWSPETILKLFIRSSFFPLPSIQVKDCKEKHLEKRVFYTLAKKQYIQTD